MGTGTTPSLETTSSHIMHVCFVHRTAEHAAFAEPPPEPFPLPPASSLNDSPSDTSTLKDDDFRFSTLNSASMSRFCASPDAVRGDELGFLAAIAPYKDILLL